MTTRLTYGATGTGKQITDFVNDVENVIAEGRRLMAKLNSASSGSDWVGLETEVGGMVGGATPPNGQTLWTILSTAVTQIDSPQVAELARLDKGV